MSSDSEPATWRLRASDYLSPYFRTGAPGIPITRGSQDKYADLRAKAIATLEGMGFEAQTMVERGVTWSEDQDPFGHVMHSQFIHFFGLCWQRVMEAYGEFLSDQDYKGMISAKTVIPVVSEYMIQFKRQVQYPDSLIIAYRQEKIEASRNTGDTVIFSLQQQAIVAQTFGTVTFIGAKTGRAVDIRQAGDGWLRFYNGFVKKGQVAAAAKQKWEELHPRKERNKL